MTVKVAFSGSLRNRLVVTLIGGAALLALLLFFAVRSYAVQIAQSGQDSILEASVTSILDAAAIRNGVIELDLPYSALSMLNTVADDRVFYAILENGDFLSGYQDLVGQTDLMPSGFLFETRQIRDSSARVVSANRLLIGADRRIKVQVILAQTQDALSETLSEISRNAALFGFCFFTLVAGLSFWATKNTIGQLDKLTHSVTRRGPHDLRPFTKPVPREMAPLVTSLNSLMMRLEQSFAQSEDFIAEAAHRVRTPLATVRSYAEATLQRVDKEENRDAMRAMVKAIDESSRAAGQLLDHAMITFRAGHLEQHPLDLVELAQDLVLRLTPIADMKDLKLELDSPQSVPFSGDSVLLQNALRNLIDNAMKYGPTESSVEISISHKEAVQIKVCDFGPGFPAHEIDTLTKRFQRGENAKGTIGSGLGLTIARDVIEAHGGEIQLSNRSGGGACVTLSL
ncbi:sensor histidine kinase [Epibacterium ulvae]|uniref:sensor histidine kinase n=1 Tax=Epibacterium ulvae TaxID=1156985 RepID=UPI002491C15E|nr:sensor histidine kinase [Epibacterium ulvae]